MNETYIACPVVFVLGFAEGDVEIEIIEVDSKGAKYDDTCISEIGFYTIKD